MAKLSLTELRDHALKEQRKVDAQRDALRGQLQGVDAVVRAVFGDRAPHVFWVDARRWEVLQELVAATHHGAWDSEYHGALEQEFPEWGPFLEGGPGNANWTNCILAPDITDLGTVVIRRVDQDWLLQVVHEGQVRNYNKPKTLESLENRLRKLV